MVQYILGIDEGTTSARAFVIDDETNIRGFGQAELTQLYPHPGSIEHDPMQILSLQLEVIRAALRDAGIRPDQLSVAGLTNQRETAVVWAKDSGRPIHNAVVWASRQTVDVVQSWIDRGIAPLIRERTGLIPDAFYAASKIRWILDRIPDAQRTRRARRTAGRHRRLVAHLEPHRPALVRDRLLQRVTDDDDEPAHARVGRRTVGPLRDSARDARRDRAVGRAFR